MSENVKIAKTFKDAGTRPIESEQIEIVETFNDAGTRQIAESPYYLVPEQIQKDKDPDNSQSETSSK